MTDLLRQEIATAAHTVVVKVGTRVLTGAGGTLNESASPPWPKSCIMLPPPGAKWPWSLPAPWAPAWGSCAGKRPDQSGPIASRGRGGPKLSDRSLRPGPARPRPPRRPASAHGRRPGRSDALSQRAQHDPDAVRFRRRADHQRKRHRQRRRIANHVRRQRSAGRHGHQPVWRRCWCCSPMSTACSMAIRKIRREADSRPSPGSMLRSWRWFATRPPA